MSCFKHMQQQQQMWPWDELFQTLPPPAIEAAASKQPRQLHAREGGMERGWRCLWGAPCLQSISSPSPLHHAAPALAAPGFAGWRTPRAGRRGENRRQNKQRTGVFGLLGAAKAFHLPGVLPYGTFLQEGKRVHSCVRTKHPTPLQKSQDGSATPSSLACQLADDGCRKLTWLPIPTPLPSQPHPFPKPPQRIKLQFAELVDDARHCPVRKGASDSM